LPGQFGPESGGQHLHNIQFNTYLNTLSFMLIIALALFIPVLAGIVGWIRSKIHSE
jgi:hypothetical protein